MSSQFTDSDEYGRKADRVTFDLSEVPEEYRKALEAACRKGVADAIEQGMEFKNPVVVKVRPDADFCTQASVPAHKGSAVPVEAPAPRPPKRGFGPGCFICSRPVSEATSISRP